MQSTITYTYDPRKITDGGIDQMRFELQDTVVDPGPMTCALCDQEYQSIIDKYGENWKKAKYECLKAICMKMAYEVDTSISGLSESLSHRYDRWKEMKDSLKKDMRASNAIPKAGNKESLMPHGGTPYFYNDMQTNIRKF